MPRNLAPIPASVAIVEQDRSISMFFRMRWQELIDAFRLTPTVAVKEWTAQAAAIVTTNAYVTLTSGTFRVSYYLRVTAADGVMSLVGVTIGWTDGGAVIVQVDPDLTSDSVVVPASHTVLVRADAASAITVSTTYGSATPGKMHFGLVVVVEQMA